jgi:hypothetical protein
MGTLHHGSRRKKPTRLRGYRIRIWYRGQIASDPHCPFLWAPEPHLPPEWEATKNNPNVAKAILIRSGKPFEQFTRPPASLHQERGQSTRS